MSPHNEVVHSYYILWNYAPVIVKPHPRGGSPYTYWGFDIYILLHSMVAVCLTKNYSNREIKSPIKTPLEVGHSEVLTSFLAPVLGNLTLDFVKSPTLSGGWGMTLIGALCLYDI